MKKRITILILPAFVFLTNNMLSQDLNIDSLCIKENELHLYNLVNKVRIENEEDIIPLSRDLTYIAKLHVGDLTLNHPDTSVCNMHSWSDKGDWIPCCHNIYLPKSECMLMKTQELTEYKGPGYELTFWDTFDAEADSVIALWRSIDVSMDMINNHGNYADLEWRAMGVAISGQYALVWFGAEEDKSELLSLCGSGQQITEEGVVKDISNLKVTGGGILSKTETYHIIFGSYNNLTEAEKMVRAYRGADFPESGIIRGDNNFRISLKSYPDLQKARNARDKLGDRYKNAWILKY